MIRRSFREALATAIECVGALHTLPLAMVALVVLDHARDVDSAVRRLARRVRGEP